MTMNKNFDTTQRSHSLNEWERHQELLLSRNVLIASRFKALDEEWKLESAMPPEGVNIDKLTSLNIQYQGLIREAKELSMEMQIHTEKGKELQGEYLEVLEGKEAEVKSGVSGGASMPLKSTITPQPADQKEPESRPDDRQAHSDTTVQLPSTLTPLPIAKPVPSAQEENKSRAKEWLCHFDILRSRAALQSSRSAAFFEEMERERIFRPEGADEKLSTWISGMDEQMRGSRELKLEMDVHEESYWKLDGVVKQKLSRTGDNFDGKRVDEVEVESEVESSIPSTRKIEISAQSSAPSLTLPLLNITTSAKDQLMFCLKEWDTQFDIFRSRAILLTSRSNALDEEISLCRPHSRTTNRLRSWIAQMEEMMRERDDLKEEIVVHGEKIREHLRVLDAKLSWRIGYEEGLSRRVDGLKGMLNIYGKKDLQRLEGEVENSTRPQDDADLAPTSDPLNIALAETESSITALLSTYKKAEISSLNSTLLTAHPFPAPSDANLSKKPAFHAAADDDDETKRALEDYLRIMKEAEELRAMRERKAVLDSSKTRDCYENALIAKKKRTISAAGIFPPTEEENTSTITMVEAEILNSDDDKDDDDDALGAENSQSKYNSTTTTTREMPQQQQQQQHALLWPWVVPLVYTFLTLLVRSAFWVVAFITTEGENQPPSARLTPPRLVNPCDTDWDSQYCSSGR